MWNSDIKKALKDCKKAWWQWRGGGEPFDKSRPLVIQMKQAKRLLRKAQGQAEAKRTIEKNERIMSSDASDREFYRLVREQRKTSDPSLQFLTVNGKILESTDDICNGWATQFAHLATPLENENFDQESK